MKKAFTMIELIFVIVILGILAAVAIPKLNATRDDAEFAKAAQNLATLMNDFASYYTAQGKLADKITAMTNVPLSGTDTSASYQIKGADCITFELDGSNIKMSTVASPAGVCKQVLDNPSTRNILSGRYTCQDSYKRLNKGTSFSNATSAGDQKDGAYINKCATKAQADHSSTTTAVSDYHPVLDEIVHVEAGKVATINFAASGVSF